MISATNQNAAQLARLVERIGADLALTDVQERRRGRAERVQAAWLQRLDAPNASRRVNRAVSEARRQASAGGA